MAVHDEEDGWSDAFDADCGSDNDDMVDEEQEKKLEEYVLVFILALIDYALGDNDYISRTKTSKPPLLRRL